MPEVPSALGVPWVPASSKRPELAQERESRSHVRRIKDELREIKGISLRLCPSALPKLGEQQGLGHKQEAFCLKVKC